MKLTNEQMDAIYKNDETDFEYEKIEESEWVDDGKHQSCDIIFKKDEKFYAITIYRSGSYWNGYEYEFWENEACEVEQTEVMIKVWKSVKNNG